MFIAFLPTAHGEPVCDLSLAVLERLVQFRQQILEHFEVLDQRRSCVDSEGKIELGKIPRGFADHLREREVGNVGQPVHKRFRSDCENGIREDECTKGACGSAHMGCKPEAWRLVWLTC